MKDMKNKEEKPKESYAEKQKRIREDIDEWIEDYTEESRRKNSNRRMK